MADGWVQTPPEVTLCLLCTSTLTQHYFSNFRKLPFSVTYSIFVYQNKPRCVKWWKQSSVLGQLQLASLCSSNLLWWIQFTYFCDTVKRKLAWLQTVSHKWMFKVHLKNQMEFLKKLTYILQSKRKWSCFSDLLTTFL